ncbi:NADPH-Cytochrome P450 reductase [Smittium culicis]|uniref:NADPH--hemoprotein reductase n=2 Tax=Smittium culicis TaxID=133412 RepID=A0A1R1X773_9FUNG|nr:NADPH-Cytochrome P450 reductase [Smittium culicis]OMJ10462.1 NADPH-Cytochrome P450 reductase [Smittium culicis]OMJ18367.1 NADPH-Cytochrome P450 reductase [Smittium culicis]
MTIEDSKHNASTTINQETDSTTYRFGSFEPISEDSISPVSETFNNPLLNLVSTTFSSAYSIFKAFLSGQKSFYLFSVAVVYIFFSFFTDLSLLLASFITSKSKVSPLKSPSQKSNMKSNSNGFSIFNLDRKDLIIMTTMVVGASTFIFRKLILNSSKAAENKNADPQPQPELEPETQAESAPVTDLDRSIPDVMKLKNKNIAIFYGSQTGTAEDLANRLSRSLQNDFGALPFVIDPEDFDVESLSRIPSNYHIILVLSTTGEGEPTDNMVKWYKKLIPAEDHLNADFSSLKLPNFQVPEDLEVSSDYVFDKDLPLKNLHFSAFGLGNTTYENFNVHVKQVSKRLVSLGAQLIGPLGLGDDDDDVDHDFSKWKDAAAPLIAQKIDSSSAASSDKSFISDWIVSEVTDAKEYDSSKFNTLRSSTTENESQLHPSQIKVDNRNPWGSVVCAAKQLCHPENERQTAHVEFDISDSDISYTTGDHVAVWPINSDIHVDALIQLLNVNKDQVVKAVPNPESTNSNPFQYSYSTYEGILTHYMDVTSPISQDNLKQVLLPNVSSQPGKEFIDKLINDKSFYSSNVTTPTTTPAELLQELVSIETKSNVPADLKFVLSFDVLLSLLPRLSPRFYSISSSSKESPNSISTTVVALQYMSTKNQNRYGVASNYLNAIVDATTKKSIITKETISSLTKFDPPYHTLEKIVTDSLFKKADIRVPIFVRKSVFKLPSDPSIPIVMVGPGTGLAPFRAFIRERAFMINTNNEKVGPTVLFFGNRYESKDYLYKEELESTFETLSKSSSESKLFTAFSRDTDQKVYVQNRILENSELVYKLLFEMNGYFYICGDGSRMAVDVAKALLDVAKAHNKSDSSPTDLVESLKKTGRYQEDIWF